MGFFGVHFVPRVVRSLSSFLLTIPAGGVRDERREDRTPLHTPRSRLSLLTSFSRFAWRVEGTEGNRNEKTRGGWMACDRRLTTLRYGRDHYVSRLPRHTPRLSSLASVAHPSLHPLVPEARRRRGEGTRGGGRKTRRDGPLHITYSTRSAGRVRPFPHLSSLRFPTVPSLRYIPVPSTLLPTSSSCHSTLVPRVPFRRRMWP